MRILCVLVYDQDTMNVNRSLKYEFVNIPLGPGSPFDPLKPFSPGSPTEPGGPASPLRPGPPGGPKSP